MSLSERLSWSCLAPTVHLGSGLPTLAEEILRKDMEIDFKRRKGQVLRPSELFEGICC